MAHVRRARSGTGWEARYRDPMGKERGRTFSTKREAELFLARQSADIQRGDYLDPRLARTTFGEWAEEWLATTVHLKPKTQVSYESILRSRVLPVFGNARIAAIEQVDVRRFIAELNKAGDQPGTIRNTFNVLRLVMATAVGSGAIRVNPCTGVRIPKSSRDEMLFLTPEEVLALARAITEDFRVLVLFAAYTGLRAGEMGPCELAGSTCCAGASM
jgi:integrase